MRNSIERSTTSNLNIVIHGRHTAVSKNFKEQVTAKLSRIERFSLNITRVDVEVTHESNPRQSERAFEIELTSDGTGPFVRAMAHAADQYTAFDLAFERFEEQLRRLHERNKSIKHQRPSPSPVLDFNMDLVANDAAKPDADLVLSSGPLQVELKHPSIPELSVEQAVERMEASGLKFLLFIDSDSGLQSVLYPRHGYDYGLVQLDQVS
ncbi:MAG: ribosome-associated translation inhibitor RaiA [Actinobacteria bacterium]|nr:ribosome-associated translation inhibitor RaiA [Actinomycetota bacterium]NBY15299.1 ribosome-associated translation inhibitor RaiA [Actinomycetota bacterium]